MKRILTFSLAVSMVYLVGVRLTLAQVDRDSCIDQYPDISSECCAAYQDLEGCDGPGIPEGDCDTVFCSEGMDQGLEDLGNEVQDGTGIITEPSITKVILGWVRFALIITGVIAFVAIVWAGILYITAFTNEENNEKAKKIIIWCAIGIMVILFSYVIVNALINAST
jgi:hypothetical protein